MSYTVGIPATRRDVDSGYAHAAFGVTTFAGGAEYGRMVQITIGSEYAQLTMEQVADLIEVLAFARDRSLVDHPRCDG
jgi:hypothetical protein